MIFNHTKIVFGFKDRFLKIVLKKAYEQYVRRSYMVLKRGDKTTKIGSPRSPKLLWPYGVTAAGGQRIVRALPSAPLSRINSPAARELTGIQVSVLPGTRTGIGGHPQ